MIYIINNISKLSIDDWDKQLNTNLRGCFLMTKMIIDNLKSKKTGKIVFFPGGSRYMHGVTKVTSGARYTLAGWFNSKEIEIKREAEIGLINEVLGDNDLKNIVLEKALKISKKSSMTLKIGKQAFYNQINMNLSEAYDYASNVMVENMLKIDAEEGIDAYINKRNPNWQDK